MAFPTGWLSQSAIVVQHGQVPADQTAFPVVITEACFATNCPEILTTGDAHAAQSDGGDLRFSTDSAGTNQIACEVVSWSQNATFASAKAEIWVPADILTASNVTVYVWWEAGGGLSQPAANASFGSQAVWSSGFKGVWHLQDVTGGAGTVTDSTSNANNGSPSGSPTNAAGKFGGGSGAFALASSQYVNCGNNSSLKPTAAFAISCWVQIATDATLQFEMGDNSTGGISILYRGPFAPNDRQTEMVTNNGATQYVVYGSTGTFTGGVWYFSAGTYDGTTLKLYRDGGLENQVTQSSAVSANSDNFLLGALTTGPSFFLNGKLDECRISDTVRSADWILTEYHNQNSPGTFAIAGARTPVSTPDVTELLTDTLSISEQVGVGRGYLFTDTLAFSDAITSGATGVGILISGDFINLKDAAATDWVYFPPGGQRGNIDYDQIRRTARSGDGTKLLTLKGAFVPGNTVVFDADGNLIDAGHT